MNYVFYLLGGMLLKAMKNYINTQCDLDLTRTRLDVLLEKKESIQRAYIMAGYKKSLKTSLEGFDDQNMSLYIRELLDKNPATNQSLIQEIVWARKEIRILEQTLDQMKKILYRMNGIARELFVEVACNGLSPTKAVEKVSEKENVDYRTGWRYYKKIKPQLQKLNEFSC